MEARVKTLAVIVAVVTAAAVLGAACGGGSPSGAEGATTSAGGGGSPAGGGSPTGGGRGGGGFSTGTAHVEVSDGTSKALDLPLDRGFTTWFPQGMHLVWKSGDEHLTISGTSQAGSRATGAGGAEAMELDLTVATGNGTLDLFVSTGGECTVDVTRSDASGVEGTFECAAVPSTIGNATADATGSFSAS